MHSSQVRQIHTRHSARVFGINITNMPLQRLPSTKKIRAKTPRATLSSSWQTLQPEVHPYIREINDHTHKYEHESYILDSFMPRHREILMGWLVEVHPQLCFNYHTLYLAILIVDKYCQSHPITKAKYQLLGITALFIAAKYEEVRTPKLKNYHAICGGEYSLQMILGMESDVLVGLSFKIKSVTACWHLEQYMQLAKIQSENKQLCFYILELSLIEFTCSLIRPTLLAWAIVFYVLRTRNLAFVSENQVLEHFHITSSELRESVESVMKLFRCRRQGRFRSVNQKYLLLIGHIVT